MIDAIGFSLIEYTAIQCVVRGIPYDLRDKIVDSAQKQLEDNKWLSLHGLEEIIVRTCTEAGVIDVEAYKRDHGISGNLFGWTK